MAEPEREVEDEEEGEDAEEEKDVLSEEEDDGENVFEEENKGELSSGEEEPERKESKPEKSMGSGDTPGEETEMKSGGSGEPPKEGTEKRSMGFGESLSDETSEETSEGTDEEPSETSSRSTGDIKGRDFEKEGPGVDRKYVLEHIIGPLLKNMKNKTDKDWIMDNILHQMVDLVAGSPEYDMISQMLDELLEDVVEDEGEEEVEEEEGEKETTKEYLHYLIDMYCIPHRKEPFQITYEFLEACLHRLTDRRKELLLRGNDMMLYMHRRIGDDDLKLICDFVKSRPDVITLDLAYNSITDFGMQIIAELLQNCPSLHRLNLMNNDFGAAGMKELAEIADQLCLDTLRVAGNEIGVEGGTHAASLLKAKNNLLYLDVAQTSQRLQSLMDHIDALITNNRLLYINFSRPLGEPMIGFDSGCWADAVGRMLRLNSTLREIYLQKSHFICHDMERLMLCAQNNRTLYLLDLSCNNIGDHGVFVLGEYLKTRPALIVLLLAHNNIADEGGRLLHYAIPNSRLQMLDVSYNRMSDRGIMAIITTLKKPTHIRALYIWGNKITHPTCQILKRHFRSKVLDPEGMDIRVYRVDEQDYIAYYPADRYHVLYYCVPRVRFDLFHYPPKRRPPAPPDIGRVCFRLPYHWRLEPLDLRCPDTGPHARVSHAPRYCWEPRPPLPPGVDPEFMKAQRARRTYRELRFVLDEFGEVVDRHPDASGELGFRPGTLKRLPDHETLLAETGSAPASVRESVAARAASGVSQRPQVGSASSYVSKGPSLRASLKDSPSESTGSGPWERRAVGSLERRTTLESDDIAARRSVIKDDEEYGEGEEMEEEEEEGQEERKVSPVFTRDEIVEKEPWKERRLEKDFLEGQGEKPNELVEERTRKALETETERKPVDGRGEMYKREKGSEPPMEEFEARRSKSKGTEDKGERISTEEEDAESGEKTESEARRSEKDEKKSKEQEEEEGDESEEEEDESEEEEYESEEEEREEYVAEEDERSEEDEEYEEREEDEEDKGGEREEEEKEKETPVFSDEAPLEANQGDMGQMETIEDEEGEDEEGEDEEGEDEEGKDEEGEDEEGEDEGGEDEGGEDEEGEDEEGEDEEGEDEEGEDENELEEEEDDEEEDEEDAQEEEGAQEEEEDEGEEEEGAGDLNQ